MQFLRSTVADFQLRTRISRAIADVTSNQRLTLKLSDCDVILPLAEEHPKLVLVYLSERMSGSSQTATYLGVLLLDILVNSCSYSFHEVLAAEKPLQQRLIALASDRAESESQRKVRSAARNIVLDFSRTFFDDARLMNLSLLAEQVEKRTGKKLLRSIQIERSNVRIIDPRPEDIILISPIRRGPTGKPLPPLSSLTSSSSAPAAGSSSSQHDANSNVGHSPTSASSSPSTSPMSKFWVCEMCTFVNSKQLDRCTACGSKKPLLDGVPISSPTTTNPPSHHDHAGNVHPAPAASVVEQRPTSPLDADEVVEGNGARTASSSHHRQDPNEVNSQVVEASHSTIDSRTLEESARAAEEAAAARAAEEAAAAQAAEEAAARAAEETAAARAAEEAAAEEAAAAQAAEEAAAARAAEEAAAARAAEEAAAARAAEEAAAARAAEEAAAEEAAAAQAAEEAAATHAAAQAAEEAAAARAAEEAAATHAAAQAAEEAAGERVADSVVEQATTAVKGDAVDAEQPREQGEDSEPLSNEQAAEVTTNNSTENSNNSRGKGSKKPKKGKV